MSLIRHTHAVLTFDTANVSRREQNVKTLQRSKQEKNHTLMTAFILQP